MKKFILAITCSVCIAINGFAQSAAYLTTSSEPWGQGSIISAFNTIYGSEGTGWSKYLYGTAASTIFTANRKLVFIEGGNANTTLMKNFLADNWSTINTWIGQGNSLIVDAATNESIGKFQIGSSGVYSERILTYTTSASSPTHPLLTSATYPAYTAGNYTGNYIAHNVITGSYTSSVLTCPGGNTMVEKVIGSGRMIVSGLTLPWFITVASWQPQPQCGNLLYSMLSWAKDLSSGPEVTTTAISSNALTTATSGGNVTSDGGKTITARGIVWNTAGSPSTSSYTGITSNGTGTGAFTSYLTSLTSNTTYYVKAYATNDKGTSYGSQISFITFPDNPSSPVASPSTICSGSGTGLSVSGAQGSVYWYTGSCGGTYVGSGNPLTVYPTTSTTYYARNYNGNYSAGCVQVSVTVNQPASVPSSATASATEKTTASLSWGSSTGLTPITYTWAVGTTTGVTYESGYTARGTTSSGDVTPLAATATGLSQSTTYYLRVKASNSCNSSGSAYVTSSSFRTHSLLTYIAGTNGTLSGTTPQTIANTGNGTAVIAVPNTGYNFVNWSDGSTAKTRTDLNVTSSITVTANFAPNRLVFGTQPVNKMAGEVIPLTVRITDTYGITMSNATAAVTIVILNNPSIASAGVLGGTATVNAVAGVATFSDLWINKTGTGYTLKASSPSPIVTTPVSSSFNIIPSAIDHFTLAGITDPVVAGITTTPIVTAYDQYNNIKTDYTGTIAFTSIDAQAVLPSSHAFVSGDNGFHSFTNLLTLKTTGEQTVIVTGNSKTGTQSAITVTPAALDHFTLTTQHSGTETAGTAFTVTATAIDLFGNIKTNYNGTYSVNWTTTATSSIKGNARIIAANGNQTFTDGVSAGITGFTFFNSNQTQLDNNSPTITITDGLTAKLGTTSAITVKNDILHNFKVVAGTSQAGGVPFSVTVTARDVYWNTCVDYAGSIRFKSSDDALVSFPAGLHTFAPAATYHGVQTFSNQITINRIGAYWLRAADATYAYKSGEQQNILIGPGAFSPEVTQSFITVNYNTRIAGEFVTVTITPRDAQGNLLYACRDISVLLNGSTDNLTTVEGTTALRPIVVNNVGDGLYTAIVRVTTSGTNIISARFNDPNPDVLFTQTRSITVTPATASHIAVTGSGSQVAGDAQTITLTAYDEFDNIATGYTGEKQLSFSGANVSATPSTSPTVAGTSFGSSTSLTFSAGIITGSMSLYKVETALVSVTDGTINSTGHILSVGVTPAAANYLAITGTGTQVAGVGQAITVTAYDQYNNVATGYTGSHSLTFSGPNPALTSPATNPTVASVAIGTSTSLTFTSGVASGSMKLYKAEAAEVTTTDGTINSTDHKLSVGVTSAPGSYLAITGTGTQVAGESQTITVTAYDVYNNVATGYTGDKALTFAGANVSPSPSTSPKVATTAFGTSTTLTFTSGIATGSMLLYKVETALVTAADGPRNADLHKLSVVVSAAISNYFIVTGTGTQVAGTSQDITVTAYDAFNNLTTAYSGDKALTFSGANVSPVPSSSPKVATTDFGTSTTLTFTSGAATGSMLLYKVETALVTVTDATINSDNHKLSVVVSHTSPSYLAVTGNGTQIAGASQTITVKAYDTYNNLATGYTGSKSLTFTGAGSSPTPVTNPTIGGTAFGTSKAFTFTSGTSMGGMLLYKTETALVTATDGSINADLHKLSVLVNPALLKDFLVYGVSNPHDLGTTQSITVEARDTYNNRKTNYTGKVTFSNTDIDATPPVDYQFVTGDLGIHTFAPAILFSKPGSWWITAIDMAESFKYGAQPDIIVQRAVTITATNRTKTYGDVLTMGTTGFTVAGIVPGAGIVDGEITGVTLTSDGSAAAAHVAGSPYSITPSTATGTVTFTANPEYYRIVYSDAGKLTVNLRDLTISATGTDKTYDGNTTATVTLSDNKVTGDDVSTSYTAASFETSVAGNDKTVNVTGIAITGIDAPNYSLSSTTAATTADINPLSVVVTPYSGQAKTYGSADPEHFTYSFAPALLGSDVITGEMGRAEGESVNEYAFAVGTLTAGSNYALTISSTPKFNISKANLFVSAENKNKCFDGSIFTGYSLTYNGFKYTDNASSLNTSSLAYGGTAIEATTVGIYTIIPSGITSANYTLNYINGSLTINPSPVPVISGSASVCAGSTGNVYTTESGMTGYTWTVSAGGTITGGGTTSDNTITITWNTAASQKVSVNYSNINSCTATSATEFNVTVNPLANGGTLSGGSSPILLGVSTGTITLSDNTGDVIKWQKRLGTGSWTDVANTSTTYSTTPNVIGTWEYRAVVQSGTCSSATSGSVSIEVLTSDAGAVTGGSSPICLGSSTGTMTLAGYIEAGTIVKWQKHVDGGEWSDISNTTATYSETPSAAGIWEYRAIITNGGPDLTSAPTEIIVVSTTIVKGSVAGGTTICSGSTSSLLTLSGNTGTVAKWQSSVSPFSTWTDIVNTSNTYTSGPLTATTRFRAVVQKGDCATDNSDATEVVVTPATIAGTVTGGTIVCSGSASGLLTLSGHNGTVVKWQSSVDPYTTWTDIANTSTTYTSGTLLLTTQFRAVVKNGNCLVVNSSTTTVTVNPLTNVGSLSARSTPILLGQSTGTITLSGKTGDVVKWQKHLSTIETWTDVANTSTTFSATPNVVGTWEYRVVVQSGTCSIATSGSVSIEVLTSAAGAVTGGSPTICLNGSTGTMTLAGYTGTIVKWQKHVDGGAWSDIDNTTTTYTETPSAAGTWEYRAIINNSGSILTSAPTEVIVGAASRGGTISGSASVCVGTNSTTLTLSEYDGTVQKWQSSVDNWTNTVDIVNTTATLLAENLTVDTKYRAVVSGICFPVNSGVATITMDPISVGGSVSGTAGITYGSSTGTMTLSGQTGIVNKWQRKLNTGGSWVDITNTAITYSEIPSASGTWYYRAVVQSGVCSETISTNAIITVDKKGLTVTGATVTSKPYDGNNTATITNATLYGVVGSDVVTLENRTSGTFAQTTVGTGISVATTPMTIAGDGVSNYTLTQPVLTGDITVKPITVTADAQSKVYGAADLVLTYTFAPALITGDAFTGALSRASGENVGDSYAISQGTLDAGINYIITFITDNYEVTARPVTVTANSLQTKVYGASDPAAFTYIVGPALIDGDSFTGNLSRTAGENVGSFAINQGTLNNSNYSIEFISKDFTITKAMLTATADPQTKVYGAANPSLIFQYTGFVNGEGKAVLTTEPSASTLVDLTTPVGIVANAITLAGGADENYDFTYRANDFTITKAMLTAIADPKTKVYGAANPALTFQYSGFVNGEDKAVLTTEPSVSTLVDLTTPAGIVADGITLAGGAADNYDFTYLADDFTITKAMLTATADPKTKVYGAANPALTFQYSGFVNGEDKAVITTEPSGSTTVGLTTPVGIVADAITLAGGVDDNYDFTYLADDFTITKAMLTVTASPKTKVYGAVNPALTFIYSGFRNGDNESVIDLKPTTVTTALQASNAGTYPIVAAGGSDNNYDFTYTDGVLTITKANLSITAGDKSKIYKTSNPALTVSYSGFVLGEGPSVLDALPVANTAAVLNSDAGTYNITASGAADGNYSFTYINGTLTITKADQTITFTDIPDGLRMSQQYQLVATASSQLAVRFVTSDRNIGGIDGNLLTIINDGDLTITASQPGDNNWNPAPAVSKLIRILPTFDNISSLFTPNADGMNDYWRIPDLDKLGKVDVKVYNRYGKLVYESVSYNNDWDGTWRNLPLPSASYYYIINSSTRGMIKGVVNIVR